MSNTVTKAVKKTTKKATKKVVRSGVNYAKGYITKGIVCWVIAAALGFLPTIGIELPTWLTGADTITMVGFVIAGFICFGRKLTVGRCIGLIKTFLK